MEWPANGGVFADEGNKIGGSTFSIYFCPFYGEIVSFDLCGSLEWRLEAGISGKKCA